MDRVGFHNFKFLRRKLAGLIQYRVWNSDFSHIMHNRGQRNLFYTGRIDVYPQLCMLQYIFGDLIDSPNMIPRLRAPKFNRRGQGFNHPLIQFSNMSGLFQKLFLLMHYLTG